MTTFPSPERRPPIVLAVGSVLAFALLALLSLARYWSYNIGMLDLGNISQAIWSVQRGAPLVYTSPNGNISRLAGHVELIYFALAPLLRLWPSPQVLLVAQAGLFVSGAIPMYAIAGWRFPRGSAVLFALGYLIYPTAVAAVLFDIHGDTFAMPLLMWMLSFLDARAWRRFWLCLALSLLCKFYIVAPIGVLGLSLLSARTTPFDLIDLPHRRRLGFAIAAVAGLYGAIVLLVIRPRFAAQADGAAVHYLSYYFGALTTLSWPDLIDRLVNVLAVLLPSAGLWWWARATALPALAIILPAVISTGPGASFAWSYHHYAAAVPFLLAGSIVGAARRNARTRNARLRSREVRSLGMLFFGASLVFHIGLNHTPLSIPFWRDRLGAGWDASAYGWTERDALKDRWLGAQALPDGPIAVSNFFAPHLVAHPTLFLARYPDEATPNHLKTHLPSVQTVLLDALFDFVQDTGVGYVGGTCYDADAIRMLLQTPGWSLTSARDGLLRFDRSAAPSAALSQRITSVADDGAAQARFGDAIELVSSTIEPLGERRFKVTFRWRALRDFGPDEYLLAVSALDGVPNARIVHLPSYVLQPTTTWRADQVWEEQFEVALPSEIAAGSYTWRTAWFDANSPYASLTDDRSRVGEAVPAATISVP